MRTGEPMRAADESIRHAPRLVSTCRRTAIAYLGAVAQNWPDDEMRSAWVSAAPLAVPVVTTLRRAAANKLSAESPRRDVLSASERRRLPPGRSRRGPAQGYTPLAKVGPDGDVPADEAMRPRLVLPGPPSLRERFALPAAKCALPDSLRARTRRSLRATRGRPACGAAWRPSATLPRRRFALTPIKDSINDLAPEERSARLLDGRPPRRSFDPPLSQPLC